MLVYAHTQRRGQLKSLRKGRDDVRFHVLLGRSSERHPQGPAAA